MLDKEKRDHLISGRTATGIIVVTRCMQYHERRERERKGGRRERSEEEEEKENYAIVFATVHDKREQSADPHQLFSS